MQKRVRIVAQPHDPVSLNRLCRLLIAQATAEIKREQLKKSAREVKSVPAEERSHE